jgi:protein TonB
MSFQNNSTNLNVARNKSEKLIFAGQSNLIRVGDNNTKSEIIHNEEIFETTSSQEKITDKKIEMPSLPEISTKEESTLFASNVNNDLTSLDEKQPNQIAAAKTETTTPPKENKVKDEEPAFFVAVEEMPELVGGLKTLQGKIKYPEIAKRVGVEGKVLVQALVDETGNVISVNTIKGIGSGCDEVAMDAVRNSKFTPGKQRGKNVKVQVTIPIVFKK